MQRSDFLLVVSDERYLSVAKVPSSHSASRARRDCPKSSEIVAPLIRAGASKLDSGCIVHCRSTQSASAALTAKNDAGLGGTLQPSPWATASFRSPSPLSGR